jgi:hypothetical protein
MKTASVCMAVMIAMTTPACLAELKDENILAKLPAGYKIGFQQKNNDMLISEMVPVNQSVKNWTEMVTVQVFYALKATPDQFKAQMEKERAVACPGSESHPVGQGRENGYPSMCGCRAAPSTRQRASPKSPGSRRSRAMTAFTSCSWRSKPGRRKSRSRSGCTTSGM